MSDRDTQYAILYMCEPAHAFDGSTMTRDGTRAWVAQDDSGCWTTSTSEGTSIPDCAKTWKSEADADVFMLSWEGHPWYRKKAGPYDVVQVEPNFVQVQRGWNILT